jgi:hypothetical protein
MSGLASSALGSLNVLVGQFRRAASGAANAPRGEEASLGALSN